MCIRDRISSAGKGYTKPIFFYDQFSNHRMDRIKAKSTLLRKRLSETDLESELLGFEDYKSEGYTPRMPYKRRIINLKQNRLLLKIANKYFDAENSGGNNNREGTPLSITTSNTEMQIERQNTQTSLRDVSNNNNTGPQLLIGTGTLVSTSVGTSVSTSMSSTSVQVTLPKKSAPTTINLPAGIGKYDAPQGRGKSDGTVKEKPRGKFLEDPICIDQPVGGLPHSLFSNFIF
eukprot:TRINITY_DN3278_c0_g2_i1.p1 TRINITY_DN3278_c0_g2~~TRINITY_DN3278_c0_g2_i1.p1  ORF type:complete len:246 (-),score=35.37 TRINITY_DN3278_c0_g2_i1:250-945(-)